MESRVIPVLISRLVAVLLISCCFDLSTAGAQSPGTPEKLPNILVLIADDWSYPYAGAYGDPVVQTPNFDYLASQGALFLNAFCTAPSCSPSRASLLTGRWPHQLEEGVHLMGFLPKKHPNYTSLLEEKGYAVGLSRKGWAPGQYTAGGYLRNPAGPLFPNFKLFYRQKPANKPFCFWFGSHDPHRPYHAGSGAGSGKSADNVLVPPFLPDCPEIRNDLLDYYYEIERFDREVGQILTLLREAGELENTLIVMTSDNGMPFPRAKANLYDAGVRLPLVISWNGKIPAGQTVSSFVNLADIAPTFLEAAGEDIPSAMGGRSLLPLLTGQEKTLGRDRIFFERERHARVRKGNIGYPSRAVRTEEFLYIYNLHPDRWPAGDPKMGSSIFGDIDRSPTKDYLIANKERREIAPFFVLACGKRPAEELYDLKKDPYQLNNLAGDKEYDEVRRKLSRDLSVWMKETGAPRYGNGGDYLEEYPYLTTPKK